MRLRSPPTSVKIVRKRRTKYHENTTTHKHNQRQTDATFRLPFYDEGDILNLDAVIDNPPRESDTIRVKLIYEEPSKPIPVENPWEE